MIDRTTVDRILETARIEEVIGDFVALKKRGANYIACCPFHHEKTPSFYVSPAKGIYKCFGCGKAGSAVNFVMEHEQMSYPEALKYIAAKYGITVTEEAVSEEENENRKRRDSMLLASEFAAKYFRDVLHNTDKGKSIGLGYFKERGFNEATIEKFRLGYSTDDRTGLVKAAKKANINLDYLADCGLLIKRENTGEYIDRFFDRVIFPVYSLSGKVIAFGGRILHNDKKAAKYINSPESEIYVKNKSLYGIYQAKSAIAAKQKCYLVEGYTDVLSFHQAGIENVVASSGTSLTKGQIELIKRFTNNVTVLYDGDFAGIKASLRGIDMLLQEGLNIKVALFPDGEDPDSFAKKHTKEQLAEFLNSAEEDFMSFKSEIAAKEAGNDPIKKAQLINDVIGSIAVIPDAITREVYIAESSRKFEIDESLLKQEVAKQIRKRQIELLKKEESKEKREASQNRDAEKPAMSLLHPGSEKGGIDQSSYYGPAERDILYYLLKFGKEKLVPAEKMNYGTEQDTDLTVSGYIFSELQADDIEFHIPLYKKMFDLYFELEKDMDQDRLTMHFLNNPDTEIAGTAAKIIIEDHTLTIKHFIESLIPEKNVLCKSVPKAILVFKAKIAEQSARELCGLLKTAQTAGDSDSEKEIMEKLRILTLVRNTFAKELHRLSL